MAIGMNPQEFENIDAAEEGMWWFRGMRRILKAWVGRLPRLGLRQDFGRVLEAGCGTGYMSGWLAREYGWQMVPVDLAHEGLAFGAKLGIERLTQANIAALPFASESFSAVLSLDVLVHFERGEEMAALREFHRVLQSGGTLILRVSALDILRSRHSIYAHERQRFTQSRIRQQVEAAGFRVLDSSYANSLLLPVALFKFRVWEPLMGAAVESGVQVPAAWLNGLLEWPLRCEAAILAAGGRLPAGQSVLLLASKV
jgi:SAM-dependent methyltransferase